MKYVLLTIALLLAGAAACAGQNLQLIPDQDFEAPQLKWGRWPADSQSKVELDKTVAQHGSQSLRITAYRASDRIFALGGIADFQPGAIYRISVYVRHDPQVSDSAISYFINFREGPNKPIKVRVYPEELRRTPAGDWTLWSGYFSVPKDTAQGQFLLGVEHTLGRVWFDNIQIEKIDNVANLVADVWTNSTLGVQIGNPPLRRFIKHQTANDAVYRAASRYNGLVYHSAFTEAKLRDLERCTSYAGKPLPTTLRARFTGADQELNQVYMAYIKGFKSGADKDWQAFYSQAAALASALDGLDRDLQTAMTALGAGKVAGLPKNLGRQPRSVKPLQADGKMNRLLFGAWSPDVFSDFEKPLNLEFHASAPGVPKTYTEKTIDFSNITEACDKIQKLGYDGTFAYLPFGIHEYMYAPQWLIEKYKDDPDFFKVSWDGLKGGSSRSNYSLNYFDPAVKAYIRDYLEKYAAFCRKEPRILFYEVDQEAYPYFSTSKGLRETGYGPHALAAFHAYLRGKYQTITALNQAWGSKYADFSAIQPPPDCYVKPRKVVTPLIAEFEAFRDDAYIDYLKLIYDSIKAGDPTKPVVARHSALLSEINGARIFETCDILGYHRGAPQMQLMNVYLNSLNRYAHRGLAYMEDFWGLQQEKDRVWDERAQRRGLEKHIARTLTWGRTLQMKWYSYTAGSYIFQYHGNWMNPRYDITTVRYCVPGLEIAKRKLERVDWVLTHSQIAPARLLILQPSATMRNERPDMSSYSAILSLHQLFFKHDLLYELVPEEYVMDGRAKLSDFDAVVLPRATYLAAGLQKQLAAYVQNGGTLVAVGQPGVYDELGRPGGILTASLRQGVGKAAWLQIESAWTGPKQGTVSNGKALVAAACGKGRLLATAGVFELAAGGAEDTLVQELKQRVRRAAWSDNDDFEVVLRTAEDGQRYLFLLNPDVDQARTDTVHVASPVQRAADVTIKGGFPVAVRKAGQGADLQVRLDPGECAVIWIGK